MANALHVLAGARRLRLSAHATQVPAITKILLYSQEAATAVGANLVMAMLDHPDVFEAKTNLQQLMDGVRPSALMIFRTNPLHFFCFIGLHLNALFGSRFFFLLQNKLFIQQLLLLLPHLGNGKAV